MRWGHPPSHPHLSFNSEGHWGTTGDFTTSFLLFSLFSTALWDLANSRSVHSLMLFSHLFFCLPGLLPPFTVPCKTVLAKPGERETPDVTQLTKIKSGTYGQLCKRQNLYKLSLLMHTQPGFRSRDPRFTWFVKNALFTSAQKGTGRVKIHAMHTSCATRKSSRTKESTLHDTRHNV